MTKQTRTSRLRCSCGRRALTKSMIRCKLCNAERNNARIAEAQAVVSSGFCPTCGSGLKRNLALTGWWQCEQYGAEDFRARSNDPACGFETFTV